MRFMATTPSDRQVKRAATMRALIREPELLVLDDPSRALDVETDERLWEGLRRRSGSGVLAMTHRRAALRLANQIVLLENGKVDEKHARGVARQL